MANPYMPLYTGDYLRKTRRLNDREHGAYLLIMMALWDEGGSLPYDLEELKQIARVPSKTRNWETTVWPKIAPFFTISEGRISQARVTETLAEVRDKRKSYAERGQKGGRANGKKRKQNNAAPQAELKPSSSNQTKGLVLSLQEREPNLPQEPISQSSDSPPPSPERGGGGPSPDELQALRAEVGVKLAGQMNCAALSILDVRRLKEALRGGSVDAGLLVAPGYEPPENVAAVLTAMCIPLKALPKLQSIPGGKL